MSGERTVVVTSATADHDYAFLVPLTCMMWRIVVGYEPTVFLVGDDWLAPVAEERLQIVMRHLYTLGIHYKRIPSLAAYPDGTVAKHVRQHAACTIGDDDVWAMPTDVDLWPLRRMYFRQHEGESSLAVLYNAFGDQWKSAQATVDGFKKGVRFPTLPMCHTAMRMGRWRAAWGIGYSTAIREAMLRTFNEYRVADASSVPSGEQAEGWRWWVNSDQRVSTYVLCTQSWFPDHAYFIPRHGGPPYDRLDRAFAHVWKQPYVPGRWTDAHLPREPHKHWDDLRRIVQAHMPQHLAWADIYHSKYIAAAGT